MQPMKLYNSTPDTRTKEQFVSDAIAEIQGNRLANGLFKLHKVSLVNLISKLELSFDRQEPIDESVKDYSEK
jgi:hypothetical protein